VCPASSFCLFVLRLKLGSTSLHINLCKSCAFMSVQQLILMAWNWPGLQTLRDCAKLDSLDLAYNQYNHLANLHSVSHWPVLVYYFNHLAKLPEPSLPWLLVFTIFALHAHTHTPAACQIISL
jgi:hypothetical protein